MGYSSAPFFCEALDIITGTLFPSKPKVQPMNSSMAQADSYAVVFFLDSIWAFQPITGVLRPESYGVGLALLGMSSPTLREVPSSKSASTPAQLESLPTSQNLTQGIRSSSRFQNRPISDGEQLQIIFRQTMLCTVGKTLNYASGDAGF